MKLKHTQGEWIIRTKIDDSGDYKRSYYDILAHYEWGDQGLVYNIENPFDARLITSSPKMLQALIQIYDESHGGKIREDCYNIKELIEQASGLLIEEVLK